VRLREREGELGALWSEFEKKVALFYHLAHREMDGGQKAVKSWRDLGLARGSDRSFVLKNLGVRLSESRLDRSKNICAPPRPSGRVMIALIVPISASLTRSHSASRLRGTTAR